jgi:signal transduction histidine kinase
VDITLLKEYQHQLTELERRKKREVVDAVIRNLEADRKQLATELRDNINQILTAAKMMMEFLPVINEEVTKYTGKVKEIIYAAVDEVNKICNTINPDSLQFVALPDLVKDMVSILNREKHIKIEMEMTGYETKVKKDKDRELTVFRVIQDCLHRITHESKANNAKIKLESNSEFIMLELYCDDEKLDLAKLSRDLYITNLINRCEHFGGTFHMEKVKGEGAYFRVSIPMK